MFALELLLMRYNRETVGRITYVLTKVIIIKHSSEKRANCQTLLEATELKIVPFETVELQRLSFEASELKDLLFKIIESQIVSFEIIEDFVIQSNRTT